MNACQKKWKFFHFCMAKSGAKALSCVLSGSLAEDSEGQHVKGACLLPCIAAVSIMVTSALALSGPA
jgi:hypothetical protein